MHLLFVVDLKWILNGQHEINSTLRKELRILIIFKSHHSFSLLTFYNIIINNNNNQLEPLFTGF